MIRHLVVDAVVVVVVFATVGRMCGSVAVYSVVDDDVCKNPILTLYTS
jgi:uncharacterized protein (DUF39 family)